MTASEFESRVLRSDPDVFGFLVPQFSTELLSIAYSFTDDSDVAADLVQETWARAFLRRWQYRGTGSVRSWIRSICWNTCRGAVRKEHDRRCLLMRAPRDALVSDDSWECANDAVCTSVTSAMSTALNALPSRRRQVLLLHVLGGLPIEEVARRVGCKLGTVKSDLHRSRSVLRHVLQQ